ncbi:MAG: TrkH family potassium uptake protein [Solobacterium sp.]|nr:TrkH family potassium uptake protein [Solobacterium sp.]
MNKTTEKGFYFARKKSWIEKLGDTNKPEKILLMAFLVVIIIGSILLSLPFTNLTKPRAYLDNLFVSLSAVCVTGLTTITVAEQYNLFGKIVMIFLMEIGGLGPMTIIAIIMQRNLKRMATVEKKLFATASGKSDLYDVSSYIRKIMLYTIIFESIGFILLSIRMTDFYGTKTGLFNALFLAVSAFTNAGFDCFASDSLVTFATDPLINFTVIFLIITGGLGFMVWFEINNVLRERLKQGTVINPSVKRLSLHARVVLKATFLLLGTGALFFLMFESRNPGTLSFQTSSEKMLVSLFQSVTLRTAGFATVNIGRCTRPMLLIMCIYMLIGGSPGGTAGGIKTTTAVVLVRTAMNSMNSEHKDAVISHKRISPMLLRHAFTIVTLYFSIIFIMTVFLTITEPGTNLLPLLFEVFSAIATVGISTGITASLSAGGKIIIMILMFIGRLGPLSVYMAFHKEEKAGNHVRYPDANIIIG